MSKAETPPCHPAASMAKEEFVRLAESIYGPGWRNPTARLVNRVHRMVMKYARGISPIPPDVAERLRAKANIGPVARVIKSTLLRNLDLVQVKNPPGIIRKGPYEVAHLIAIDCAKSLRIAGLLRTDAS